MSDPIPILISSTSTFNRFYNIEQTYNKQAQLRHFFDNPQINAFLCSIPKTISQRIRRLQQQDKALMALASTIYKYFVALVIYKHKMAGPRLSPIFEEHQPILNSHSLSNKTITDLTIINKHSLTGRPFLTVLTPGLYTPNIMYDFNISHDKDVICGMFDTQTWLGIDLMQITSPNCPPKSSKNDDDDVKNYDNLSYDDILFSINELDRFILSICQSMTHDECVYFSLKVSEIRQDLSNSRDKRTSFTGISVKHADIEHFEDTTKPLPNTETPFKHIKEQIDYIFKELYTIWCIKESVVKALGTGFLLPAHTINTYPHLVISQDCKIPRKYDGIPPQHEFVFIQHHKIEYLTLLWQLIQSNNQIHNEVQCIEKTIFGSKNTDKTYFSHNSIHSQQFCPHSDLELQKILCLLENEIFALECNKNPQYAITLSHLIESSSKEDMFAGIKKITKETPQQLSSFINDLPDHHNTSQLRTILTSSLRTMYIKYIDILEPQSLPRENNLTTFIINTFRIHNNTITADNNTSFQNNQSNHPSILDIIKHLVPSIRCIKQSSSLTVQQEHTETKMFDIYSISLPDMLEAILTPLDEA